MSRLPICVNKLATPTSSGTNHCLLTSLSFDHINSTIPCHNNFTHFPLAESIQTWWKCHLNIISRRFHAPLTLALHFSILCTGVGLTAVMWHGSCIIVLKRHDHAEMTVYYYKYKTYGPPYREDMSTIIVSLFILLQRLLGNSCWVTFMGTKSVLTYLTERANIKLVDYHVYMYAKAVGIPLRAIFSTWSCNLQDDGIYNIDTVWQVIFGGAKFREEPKTTFRINFCDFNFHNCHLSGAVRLCWLCTPPLIAFRSSEVRSEELTSCCSNAGYSSLLIRCKG